jgi:DNA-binding GntR family transcriptional regulator
MEYKKVSLLGRSIPKTLSQSIYNYLKKSIIDNKFKANEKIDKQEISKLFKVSRTPVREAVVRLAAEGFAEIDSHRGATVKGVSIKEVKEITQVLQTLDALAIDLVDLEGISDQELKKLENMTSKLEDYHNQNQGEKYINCNFNIHEKIWSYSDNDFLYQSLCFCLTQINRYIQMMDRLYQFAKTEEKSLKEHEEIIKALKARDKRNLKTVVVNHWIPQMPWSELEKVL